jgi:dihydroorotate dehydrogenase (fumarate)/dihydroorotate dehydrogenase
MYESVIRPLLFRCDPEQVHNLSVRCCELAGESEWALDQLRRAYGFEDPRLNCDVAGIRFANPLGLAAGYDKNARGVAALAAMGFGHVEIGSVSAYPSAGNPKPRLFRLIEDEGVIVHYGLPNDGADVVRRRLLGRTFGAPVGVNIVKTNDPARPATDEEVFSDYERSMRTLRDCGDYFCLNLSCPNTADGRDFFADVSRVDALLTRVATTHPPRPVFLKLKPTDDAGYLRELIDVATRFPFVSGFQINLPPGKPSELHLHASKDFLARSPGAISGRPIEPIINRCLATLSRALGPQRTRFAIIAAGGVFSAEDAYRKLRLGASLVQLYTALIYRGPSIVRQILQDLTQLLTRDGFANVSQAVGADVRG